jgi:YHS domain-containing protein
MIRLLIWLLILYAGYRLILKVVAGKKKESIDRGSVTDAAITHKDPVCGMYVSESDAIVGRLDGERHYFCSMTCLEKYREQLDHPR